MVDHTLAKRDPVMELTVPTSPYLPRAHYYSAAAAAAAAAAAGGGGPRSGSRLAVCTA